MEFNQSVNQQRESQQRYESDETEANVFVPLGSIGRVVVIVDQGMLGSVVTTLGLF